MTRPAETDAARAGAELELTASDAPGDAAGDAAGRAARHSAVLGETALAAVRESLPGWDVQPFQLSRAVDVPGGTDGLRRSLEQVASGQGRVPEILVTGDHLVVRVRTEGIVGVTGADVDLATALDPVFGGSRATGPAPGGR